MHSVVDTADDQVGEDRAVLAVTCSRTPHEHAAHRARARTHNVRAALPSQYLIAVSRGVLMTNCRGALRQRPRAHTHTHAVTFRTSCVAASYVAVVSMPRTFEPWSSSVIAKQPGCNASR